MTEIEIKAINPHLRGKIYESCIDEKTISVLLTFHALERIRRWQLENPSVLEATISDSSHIEDLANM
jgi:hypothetical protein